MMYIDGSYTVGVPGTPVQVCGLFDERYGRDFLKQVTTLVIQNPTGNGEFRVGGRWVNATSGNEAGLLIAAGMTETLENVRLNELWIDGATAGQRIALVAMADTRRIL